MVFSTKSAKTIAYQDAKEQISIPILCHIQKDIPKYIIDINVKPRAIKLQMIIFITLC